MTIRRLVESDLVAAVALLDRVGLAAGAANIRRYLRWQPDGLWGWDEAGTLRGIATVLVFGHVGFVGCMAVQPAEQGRGLGRRLLEHAQAEARRVGVTTFLLEATPVGELLYRKLGYVVEYETAIYSRTATGPANDERVSAHRTAILALDALATGSPRGVMIGGLVDEAAGAVIHVGGEVASYGLVVGERLGPVIARDPGAGRAVIDQLASACSTTTVPLANEPAVAAAIANGFHEARRLQRMRLGPQVASRADWIWALASAGAG